MLPKVQIAEVQRPVLATGGKRYFAFGGLALVCCRLPGGCFGFQAGGLLALLIRMTIDVDATKKVFDRKLRPVSESLTFFRGKINFAS